MLLSIADRFRLLDLFSKQQGGISIVGAIRKLNELIEFSVEELELYEIKQSTDGRVTWKMVPDLSFEKEIKFSEKQVRFVAKLFEVEQSLTPAHFSLLEKFGVKIPEEE
jgi:hypothetical protein